MVQVRLPPQETNKQTSPGKEPTLVQLDPKCLHSALKEFFEPLRTNDSRTDFFAVYRREAEEFDRGYAKKYDEDLYTSLIFAGLFSAVSSAFILDVQSNLRPDPNQITAAYMRILIHAVNSSLFPDTSPDPAIWTGPPPGIVTVQSLLYASLAISLFAAFVAMLGKQWVNRYHRNSGGSAAEKSRDRQWKLDGFEEWHFHLIIESLPVMLQLALLLLGCALSLYLWTISRTVAGIALAFTIFGVTSYLFLTLAAMLYYDCPYQTPPSSIARASISYLKHSNATIARSLRALTASLTSIQDLGQILEHLCSGVRCALEGFGCILTAAGGAEHIPLAVVLEPPSQIFEDILVDWETCKADARCIYWVLDSTTDPDVILSAVRFTADMVWYPEIAGVLSPYILADLFFDCLSDGLVSPGKLEHATSVGMALATVLGVRLNMDPEDEGLRALCNRIRSEIREPPSSRQTFTLVVRVIEDLAVPLSDLRSGGEMGLWFGDIPPDSYTAHRLWLSRVMLQMVCLRRRVQASSNTVYCVDGLRRVLMVDGDETPVIVRTNCFLAMAIALGRSVDICDLYPPHNTNALKTAVHLFHQQLEVKIGEGAVWLRSLDWFLSVANHFDIFEATDTATLGFTWIAEILNSEFPEHVRYETACRVVRLLGKRFSQESQIHPPSIKPESIPTLLNFLLLCEKFDTEESPPHPGSIALRLLSTCWEPSDFVPTILPVLASRLLPTHLLQSRQPALEVFRVFVPWWFSPQMATVPKRDLDKLLRAVGDPSHASPNLLRDEKYAGTADFDTMMATVVLIEFASSELWRNHLRHSNFASCEDMMSTEEHRRTALCRMIDMATKRWSEFLCTSTKIVAAVRRLEELQCPNTAEVVIAWAWITGLVGVVDGWKLIEDETLRFYQTRGKWRLTVLKRHITDMDLVDRCWWYFAGRYGGSPFRAESPGQQSSITDLGWIRYRSRRKADFSVSRACKLRRLYYLFGYDPSTWQEAIAAEKVNEETKVLLDHFIPLNPPVDPFGGWMCDYP